MPLTDEKTVSIGRNHYMQFFSTAHKQCLLIFVAVLKPTSYTYGKTFFAWKKCLQAEVSSLGPPDKTQKWERVRLKGHPALCHKKEVHVVIQRHANFFFSQNRKLRFWSQSRKNVPKVVFSSFEQTKQSFCWMNRNKWWRFFCDDDKQLLRTIVVVIVAVVFNVIVVSRRRRHRCCRCCHFCHCRRRRWQKEVLICALCPSLEEKVDNFLGTIRFL